MPTYDFKCSKCETVSEVFKKLADLDKPTICEACGSEMSQAFTSAPPVHFKGGCWAKDGYSRDHVTFHNKDGSKETVPVKGPLAAKIKGSAP